MLREKLERFRHFLASPEEELTQMQLRLRWAARLVSHCYEQLVSVRAEGMAAELTYRTIFSLIPVVVLSLVMFRVVGGLEEVQTSLENQLYSFFGVPDVPASYGLDPEDAAPEDAPPEQVAADGAGPALAEPVADFGDESQEVQAGIRRGLREATEKVASLNFASLGIVGLLLFIYTAVALLSSVEHLFNIIYEAPAGRPLHLRLAIHWSIITLGSGLLAASLYLSAQAIEYFVGVVPIGVPVRLLHHGLSVLASWVLLFLLYALMPNTKVSLRAAAVGSAVGAVLWEIAKLGFQLYVVKALPYSALYGSLGLIPLFLFWIYLTWLIILFGLALTHTLQVLRGRRPTKLRVLTEGLPCGDPMWMLPILVSVASAFRRGDAADQQDLVERLQLPGPVVHEMLCKLADAGWVARLATADEGDDRYTLARPPESIRVRDVLKLAHQLPAGLQGAAWESIKSLRTAQLDAAGEQTLADLAN